MDFVDWQQLSAIVVELLLVQESLSKWFINAPPSKEVANATAGRNRAKGKPINEYVAMMESTPVCGVAIKKDRVAPLEAPSLRSDMAVGITPQEHSGRGIPKRDALKTERNDFSPKYRE